MSEWISVEERLPKEDGDYLIYGVDHRGFVIMGSDWFDTKCKDFWNNPHGAVTHWMPPPDPPESEEE